MPEPNYSRFERSSLILRDELALDRTHLANERTLLAYLRSAAALVIAGATILHFAQVGWLWGIGLACLPGGVVTGLVGIQRFLRMRKAISHVRRDSKSPDAGDTAA